VNEQPKITSEHTPEMVIISNEEYKKLLENEAKITYLQFELEKLKRMIFGVKSERCISTDAAQLSLNLG